MGQLQQRIFALSGAILFFVTSIALTVVVVITMVQEGKKSKTDPAVAKADTCQAGSQAEDVLPVPESFTSPGTTTELQKTDLSEGTGAAAKSGDCLVMKYYGTLAKDGTMFDENFTAPTAFAFTLGAGRVIPGWDQGLVGIKVGSTRRLVIPSSLAYRDQSPSEKIPANSDLVFVVKLIRIQK